MKKLSIAVIVPIPQVICHRHAFSMHLQLRLHVGHTEAPCLVMGAPSPDAALLQVSTNHSSYLSLPSPVSAVMLHCFTCSCLLCCCAEHVF